MKLSLSHKKWIYKVPIFILLFSMLSSVFTVGASAAAQESYFLETLINTKTISYQAAGTLDPEVRKVKQKYASKYIDMEYVISGDSAGNYTNSVLNPNSPFFLNEAISLNGVYQSRLSYFLNYEGYKYTSANGYKLINSDADMDQDERYNEGVETAIKHGNNNPLSFPSSYQSAVSDQEMNYATSMHSTLVSNLNNILRIINDGVAYSSVADMVNKSILIRPDDSKNIVIINGSNTYTGYVIVYADLTGTFTTLSSDNPNENLIDKEYNVSNTTTSVDFLNKNNLPRMSKNNALLCYVFPIIEGSQNPDNGDPISMNVNLKSGYVFEYAFPKGYTDIQNENITYYDAEFAKSDNVKDTPWVSIHMLSYYANHMFKSYHVSVGNTTVPTGSGMAVVDWLLNWINKTIYFGLQTILRLTPVESLVYNTGIRGTSNYNFGLMSEDWWNVVLQYQLIFQAIAWVILIIGFLKTLIDLNLSTINPQKRLTVYDTVQKFLLAGIGLVILIPCIQFMLECNNTIVKLFASQINTAELNQPTTSNLLIQFIINMVWLAILFYINFVYVMRSITIALLIASGPFFIATMSFPKGGRSSLMSSWSKELIANIFVQSVHAFTLSFLMQLLDTGTFIEQFAIAISIIPITEMFRSLIFAGAGESVSKMANTASNALMSIKNAGADAAGRTGAMIAGFRDPNAEDSSPGRAGGGGGSGAAASSTGGGGSGGGGMKPRTGSFGGANPNYMRTTWNEVGQSGLSNIKEGVKKKGGFGQVVKGVGQSLGAAAGQGLNSFERRSRDWTNLALNQDTRMRYCMEDDSPIVKDVSDKIFKRTNIPEEQNEQTQAETSAAQDETNSTENQVEN